MMGLCPGLQRNSFKWKPGMRRGDLAHWITVHSVGQLLLLKNNNVF